MTFLDGMSDHEAAFRLIMFSKNMARNSDLAFLNKHRGMSLGEFFDMRKPTTGYFRTSLVDAFLKSMGVKSKVYDLITGTNAIANKAPGEIWADLGKPEIMGLVDSIRKQGDESLRRLVMAIGTRSLDDQVAGNLQCSKFVDSDEFTNLYTVSLDGNWLGTYMKEYDILTTSDDTTRDTYATFSLEAILANPLATMEHEMNRIQQIHCDEFNTNYLNTGIFTQINIQSNGKDFISIPLVSEYVPGRDDPSKFEVDRRAAINAKGYGLDLDAVVAHCGSAKELREVAKILPRQAALRVRGMALEDALGL
jgi:hypothetical protein